MKFFLYTHLRHARESGDLAPLIVNLGTVSKLVLGQSNKHLASLFHVTKVYDVTLINRKEFMGINYDAFRHAVLPPVCLGQHHSVPSV